jgi:MoxR-like ATPase
MNDKFHAKPGQAVIVHGPQGCGKTRHAKALAAHFGKIRVVDDWFKGEPLTSSDLALTNDDRVSGPNVFSFTQAMNAAGLVNRG